MPPLDAPAAAPPDGWIRVPFPSAAPTAAGTAQPAAASATAPDAEEGKGGWIRVPEAPTPSYTEYGPTPSNLPSVSLPSLSSLSPSNLRDKLQQADTAALTALQPGPNTDAVESFGRRAAQLGVHTLARAAQVPLDAAIAIGAGPSAGATINPETNTLGATPEALSALGFAAGAGGLRFGSGAAADSALAAPTITAREVQARDGVGIMEAWQRAHAENRAAAQPAAAIADIGAAPDINSAIAAAGKAAAEAPGEAIPTVTVTAPRVPEPVGAAASRDLAAPDAADISTADMKANRRRAEMDEILAPPAPGDTMVHVPGSFPTLAEYSGDPVVSQYENLLRQRNPGDFIGEGKRLTENNKSRVDHYDANTIPDPVLKTMRDDRSKRWTAASDDILPNAKPVDFTEAHDWVNKELSNPRIQENDAVRSVLEDFRDRLTDNSGDLKTNPGNAWGIHDNLQNQLAKAKDPLNMTGAEKFAEDQLLAAKKLIDKALNVATDNKFQSALDQYAEDSKVINAGVLFNDFRPKLTNMSGELQPANFHRFVINLAKERGNPGIDPSMDITDQGMRAMINIDNDLKRAGLIKVGAPNASPTNLLGALARDAGLDAAHSAMRAVPLVGRTLSAGQKILAQRKLVSDTAKHLAPPEGGYRYFVPDESMPEPPP